jgi:hypothetical protein
LDEKGGEMDERKKRVQSGKYITDVWNVVDFADLQILNTTIAGVAGGTAVGLLVCMGVWITSKK